MILDKFKLDGKKAVVTGGTKGLGKAIALALGQAGADIALVSRGDNPELRNEIKERKLAEEALRVARDDWENIFESISDTVMILDRDRRVLDCNRFAVATLKRPKSEIVGQFCHEVFQCKEHLGGGCLHEKLLVSDQPDTVDMETEMLNGIYLVTIAPVLDS